MGTHEMSAPVVKQRMSVLHWFLLGFALVLGIGVIMFGAVLIGTRGAGEPSALSEDVLHAQKIQRFGEWYTPGPGQAALSTTDGWGMYRAGERAANTSPLRDAPDGWAIYRAGERASQVAPTIEPPPGWVEYRAGERTAE